MSLCNRPEFREGSLRFGSGQRQGVPAWLQECTAGAWTSPELARLATQPPLRELHPEVRERVTPLLARLNAPRFAVRDAAARELSRAGAAAIPYVAEFLSNPPSEEARRRAGIVLNTLLAGAGGVQRDRFGRVVQIHRSDYFAVTYVPGSTQVATAEVVLPASEGSEPMRLFFRRIPGGGFEQHGVSGEGRNRRLTRFDDIQNVTVDRQGNCTMYFDGGHSFILTPDGRLVQGVRPRQPGRPV
jgi:hypothetical protein